MEKVYQKAVQVVTRLITYFIELTKVDQWVNCLITFYTSFLKYQYLILAILLTARLSYLELPVWCDIRQVLF